MRRAMAAVFSMALVGTSTSTYAPLPSTTWVSGTGNDANNCSRSAPCLTFAGALAKTAAGGEITVLDPGSYGFVLINKSITIDGSGGLAGILITNGDGIVVSAGDKDIVTVRNLDINGGGSGFEGIRFGNGKLLIVENTRIVGFQTYGIVVLKPTAGGAQNLLIRNSTISTSDVFAFGGVAIETNFGVTTVSHSVISKNGYGLLAGDTGVINADSNVLSNNRVAVQAGMGGLSTGQSAATIRLSNNDVYGNLTGFGCGGGVLVSDGTNRKGSNTGGTVATCSPSAAITKQ